MQATRCRCNGENGQSFTVPGVTSWFILSDMAKLYRKTEKGQSEVATRANRLSPRYRAALIMVDGKRTDAELSGMIPAEPESTLAWLTESGFIELASTSANTSRWQNSTAGNTTVAPSTLEDSRGTGRPSGDAVHAPHASASGAINSIADGPPASRLPIERIKRDAVRDMTNLLGPAVEALAIKIERANSREELKGLLDMACQSIANTRGREKAREFAAKYVDGLMV